MSRRPAAFLSTLAVLVSALTGMDAATPSQPDVATAAIPTAPPPLPGTNPFTWKP